MSRPHLCFNVSIDTNPSVAATRSVASTYHAFCQNAVHAHTEAYKVLSDQEGANRARIAAKEKEQVAALKRELSVAKWVCEFLPNTSLCLKTSFLILLCLFIQPTNAMLVGGFAADFADFSVYIILTLISLFFFLKYGMRAWRMYLLLGLINIITKVAAQNTDPVEENAHHHHRP